MPAVHYRTQDGPSKHVEYGPYGQRPGDGGAAPPQTLAHGVDKEAKCVVANTSRGISNNGYRNNVPAVKYPPTAGNMGQSHPNLYLQVRELNPDSKDTPWVQGCKASASPYLPARFSGILEERVECTTLNSP